MSTAQAYAGGAFVLVGETIGAGAAAGPVNGDSGEHRTARGQESRVLAGIGAGAW